MMYFNSKVSVVISAYNEEEVIAETIKRIYNTLKDLPYNYEIIVVDDGSTDKTYEIVEQISAKHPEYEIGGVAFSRNFGKEAAIMAGLSYAGGSAVITIDADLQHPPEMIPEMIAKWESGYKIVEGKKKCRGKEGSVYKFCTKIFYALMHWALTKEIKDASDYKLLDRMVVDTILKMSERCLFYRAVSSWVGFRTTSVWFDVSDRIAGKSKWNKKSLILYAIRNITSYSSKPLQIISVCGFLYLALSVILGVTTLIKYAKGTAVEGFTTIILLELISGAFLMLAIGLTGYYLSKIYDEIRYRPRYIVEKEFGFNEEEKKE